MADIAALQTAVSAAEATKESLLVERRTNRETMTRIAFRAYNESTRVQQIETQAAVTSSTKALHSALTAIRSDAVSQVISVGTISETEGRPS